NHAFAPVMEESSTQANYVPLAPMRSGLETQPAIIALPVSKPYGDFGRVVDWKIDESLPNDVAAFVNWLINESGWTVTERGRTETRVPLQARHVCLLFRRLRHYATDVTRGYVEALESYRIPHLLVGGSSFHSREEVESIRNALTAIEWPDDELAVFATLRGALFALTDAQLLSYRTICSSLHPFKRAPEDLPESLTEVVEALEILRELHRARNQRPIAETIQTLLAQTRAHAGFANWSTGEQALANIMRLTDMARRAERNGLISFRSFVDWLDEQAESGDVGDAPIMEEGVDGVRIMTVHKAKGLEFPVVILCDITAKDSREPSKWVDQTIGLSAMQLAGCMPVEVQEHADEEIRIEREEAARVLYVAATRARDLLVVCAVGDHPYDGWLAALNPVLYPLEARSFKPVTKQPPGCPQFSEDTVVDRPPNAFRRPGSVTPGMHQPEAGNHRVIWWDISTLAQPTLGRASSRLTKFLTEDELKVHSTEGIGAHDEWQRRRKEIRAVASKPEWMISTVTSDQTVEFKGDDVALETIGIDFTRPHGKRFGTLVHSILAIVELGARVDRIEQVARIQARILGAGEQDVDAAVATVKRALEHPLVRRAAKAWSEGKCRREVPVAVQMEGGVIVEGVVDLAFKDKELDNAWVVVDYKTDFELSGRLDEYRHQLSLYSL
ncbi:MAG TPA: 3'-5' exonuclease, partial [Pyrinomonadaceae bacterium]